MIQLDMIGITTEDLARSIDFYRLLGVPVPEVDGTEPHVEAALTNGLRIAWDQPSVIRSFDSEFAVAPGRHPVALAFLVDAPGEVDALYRSMPAECRHLEPWDAVWGQRYAVLLDPDGNTVDLFAPL